MPTSASASPTKVPASEKCWTRSRSEGPDSDSDGSKLDSDGVDSDSDEVNSDSEGLDSDITIPICIDEAATIMRIYFVV